MDDPERKQQTAWQNIAVHAIQEQDLHSMPETGNAEAASTQA
jgi:hypothetical protein